ncbi:MaoC/PaaZ C-terminal domain-containing protein [Nocardia sp. NPDC058058]|uniref:MaoC/PaaZ C-terminal domain-containing protein n=1 Tax=Nocardia sp. NPDC058058 TaxID=3346317 RepID=UPI0036DD5155
MTAPAVHFPPVRHRITRADLAAYTAASGDANPIHSSDAAAERAGLKGVVAHGMLLMGLAVQSVTDNPALGAVLSCKAKFTAPAYIPPGELGTELLIHTQRTPDPDPTRTHLTLEVLQAGTQVLTATLLLAPTPPTA